MRDRRLIIPGPGPGELWTPPGTGGRFRAPEGIPGDLPPELLPEREFIVRRSDPEIEGALRITRCAVTLNDIKLPGVARGFTPSLERVIEWVTEIPFEAGMTLLAPIAADVYFNAFDRKRQIELAKRIWPLAVVGPIQDFLEEDPNYLVFDERYITVLQRLLVEYAADSDAEMDADQSAQLRSLLLAIPTALEDDSPPAADPDNPTVEERDAWARYTLKIGVYYERPYILEAVARAQGILVEACGDPALAEELERNPYDKWMRADHEGAGVADQIATGFAAAAGSGALEHDLSLEERLQRHLDSGFLAQSVATDQEERMLRSISASRDELRQAFVEEGTSSAHIAWDRAPFEQHPFLRQAGGRLQLISPRALVSWFTDGLYYRGLDCADRRPHPKPKKAAKGRTRVLGYTSLVGRLAEVYVYRLAVDAHSTQLAAGAVEVESEREYYVDGQEKLSSDLYVVQPPEVVAFEVFSGRMPRSARVTGDAEVMDKAITKMVVSKLNELQNAIGDLLEGHIPLPGLVTAPTRRVWPVVLLTGHGLLATPILWGLVRDRLKPGAFSDPRVALPTLCDLDDFESLLALVEEGATLTDLLAELHASPFAELPPRNWLSEREPDRILRPRFVVERYKEAGRNMRVQLFGRARPHDPLDEQTDR
jgi:hypothetical protein